MKAEFPPQLPRAPAEAGRRNVKYWEIHDNVKSHPPSA